MAQNFDPQSQPQDPYTGFQGQVARTGNDPNPSSNLNSEGSFYSNNQPPANQPLNQNNQPLNQNFQDPYNSSGFNPNFSQNNLNQVDGFINPNNSYGSTSNFQNNSFQNNPEVFSGQNAFSPSTPPVNNQPSAGFDPYGQQQNFDLQQTQPVNPSVDYGYGGGYSNQIQSIPDQGFSVNQGTFEGSQNSVEEYNQPYDTQANFETASTSYNSALNNNFSSQQPNFESPTTNNNSTFQVKKSGNKFLVWAIVAAVVILTAVVAILFFLNSQRNTQNQENTQNTTLNQQDNASQEQDKAQNTNDSSEDNGQTPAQLARIRNASSLPSSWLIQKFGNNGVGSNGNCTNQNICGESADPDDDGLTNIEEYNYDTDPLNDDTDGDGISDGNEVYVYFTNPRIRDSDRDGVADFQELLDCTDPINSSGKKMNSSRLDQISQNTELKPLKSLTIRSFKSNEGTDSDIEKGYFESVCQTETQPNPDQDGGTNVDL